MRLTLPNMSMVITFFSLLKNSAGQWNTLVNFESAQLALSGQFYIGLNSSRTQLNIMSYNSNGFNICN
jgi:hypothetical protein